MTPDGYYPFPAGRSATGFFEFENGYLMSVETGQRILEELRSPKGLGPRVHRLTVSKPIFRLTASPTDYLPTTNEPWKHASFQSCGGVSRDPKLTDELENRSRYRYYYSVDGKIIQGCLDPGVRVVHHLVLDPSARRAMNALMDWALENALHLWKLARPIEASAGSSHAFRQGIWFDFISAVQRDQNQSSIKIDEPATMISATTCVARPSVASAALPKGVEPEIWFTKSEHVWANSIIALEYFLDRWDSVDVETKPEEEHVSGSYRENLTKHHAYDEEKQRSLDFQNAGHSWTEMERNDELSFKRNAVVNYANATDQTILKKKPGRPASKN